VGSLLSAAFSKPIQAGASGRSGDTLLDDDDVKPLALASANAAEASNVALPPVGLASTLRGSLCAGSAVSNSTAAASTTEAADPLGVASVGVGDKGGRPSATTTPSSAIGGGGRCEDNR